MMICLNDDLSAQEAGHRQDAAVEQTLFFNCIDYYSAQ